MGRKNVPPGSPMRKGHRVLYHYGSSHLDTGSPRALLELVRLVQAMPEFEPVFLMAEAGDLPSAMKDLGVEVRGPSRVSAVSPRAPWRGVKELWYWRRMLKEWNIEILHLNEVGWNYGLVCAAYSRRIPVILHAHNPTTLSRRNVHRFAADVLLVPSESLKRDIKNSHLLRGDVRVLPNVVDLRRFASGSPIRKELGLRRSDFVVLFVGQISYRKGVDILVDVAREMRDNASRAVFLVAGPDAIGEAEFCSGVRATLREAGLSTRVRMLGSRDDIPDLMATSDVFFLPTRQEPFGIVFLEAMAARLPVVGTNIGGVPEVVGSDCGGVLIDAEDVQGYAGSLLELERSETTRTKMALRGWERAWAVFGAESVGGAVRDLYRTLLDI